MTDEQIWLQLAVDVEAERREQVEDALLEIGALAVTLVDAAEQRIFDIAGQAMPMWDKVRLTGLFDGQTNVEDVQAALALALRDIDSQSWTSESIPDEDWHRSWLDRYEPLCFGERLWVCPNWKPVPEECQVPLMLDPGRAFGTGSHPTTAMCLSWLDQFEISDKTVLDFGCGSGILAIAASLLGASGPVYAIDNDPVAMQSVLRNAQLNAMGDEQIVGAVASTPQCLQQQFDVVLANILAGPLIELAGALQQSLKPGGDIVLSGLLAEQSQSVQMAYSEIGHFSELIHEDGWVLLHGIKL